MIIGIHQPTNIMSTTLSAPVIITEQQKKQFQDEGYFVLESCVPEEHLELMRANCQQGMDESDAEMDKQGVSRLGLNVRGKRYFNAFCYKKTPALGEFVFSPLMAEICKATIGDEANLYWDQYVVKGTDTANSFSWHQDSGYVNIDCPLYLTCWVTLDDVTIENGTVYLLPYSQVGIRSVVKHIHDPRSNDMVGYFGKDPGIPVIVPAGSIAVFSSYVFHRSGPNLTSKLRRIYLPQYSPVVIRDMKGNQTGQAAPFLRNGKIVSEETRRAAV
jgi:ectoine hydroxylase-related dioxygenase (phytanoyl-CoA dioxygenase family)